MHDVLFISSEVEGLVKTGGLADVARAFPDELIRQGHKVTLMVPYYQFIANKHPAEEILKASLLTGQQTRIDYSIRKLTLGDLPVLLVDCPYYFDREGIYTEHHQGYADNTLRFMFFDAVCLDAADKLNLTPDIIHCNDWHAGFIPLLLKSRYIPVGKFTKAKTVLTVHNAAFKGTCAREEMLTLLGHINDEYQQYELDYQCVSMLKAGVVYADKVVAVSPTYARELRSNLGSQGMGHVFLQKGADLSGIVNGCDYRLWSPQKDEYLPVKYQAKIQSLIRGKAKAKQSLCQLVGLADTEKPMFGMVCRLTSQKGLQYLLPILSEFLVNDVQLVIVGTGDKQMADQLRTIADSHKDKFAFVEAYDNQLAHLVEAASEVFLMPSEFEPCGLNQMYSMAYGTLPLVRGVGGLADTVIDYDVDPENATGFVFNEPEPWALLTKMQRALLLLLQNKPVFRQMQLTAMAQNFSWAEATQAYLRLYDEITTIYRH